MRARTALDLVAVLLGFAQLAFGLTLAARSWPEGLAAAYVAVVIVELAVMAGRWSANQTLEAAQEEANETSYRGPTPV